MTAQFGPGALDTPANLVTVGRLVLTVPLLVMIVDSGASWPAVTLWIALCVTDGIDGVLARRQGTTRSGAFLDPLADKVLVLGAMIALVANGTFWWVPVAIIAVREVGIQAFRSYWGKRGLAVPASGHGQGQDGLPRGRGRVRAAAADRHRPRLGRERVLAVAVVLTLVSGVQYLGEGRRAATVLGSR